ncbi:MAG: hypothetical protein MN733_14805 [Nitrososphaera sp.]|nr:hypothetical protein [Nitrososphaera sp.]
MQGLKEAIDQRVSFLKEQIRPSHNAIFNKSLEVQIQTLRNADPEKVAVLILQKKKQLQTRKDISNIEVLYSELDALEWLQREVEKVLS